MKVILILQLLVLLVSTSKVRTKWKSDRPNLYDNTSVLQLNGEQALDHLQASKVKSPELMIAYHPDCKHSKAAKNGII